METYTREELLGLPFPELRLIGGRLRVRSKSKNGLVTAILAAQALRAPLENQQPRPRLEQDDEPDDEREEVERVLEQGEPLRPRVLREPEDAQEEPDNVPEPQGAREPRVGRGLDQLEPRARRPVAVEPEWGILDRQHRVANEAPPVPPRRDNVVFQFPQPPQQPHGRQAQELPVGAILQEIRSFVRAEMELRDVRLQDMAQDVEGRARETRKSVEELKVEREAERRWPVRSLNEPRNQHEYDALVKFGRFTERVLAAPDLQTVRHEADEMQKAIMLRCMQVTVGDSEGWRVAEHIHPAKAAYEEQFAPELEAARKKAEKSRPASDRATELGRKRFRADPAAPAPATRRPFPAKRAAWPTAPPRGGCFVCGGPHFARECPNNSQKNNPGSSSSS